MFAIFFRANKKKIIAGIQYITAAKDVNIVGFEKIILINYLADHRHINQYGRPVFGHLYMFDDNMRLYSNDLFRIKHSDEFTGKYFNVPDMNLFSGTDVECLKFAINEVSTIKDMKKVLDILHIDNLPQLKIYSDHPHYPISYGNFITAKGQERADTLEYMHETCFSCVF